MTIRSKWGKPRQWMYALMCATVVMAGTPAQAENYPSRAVKVIVSLPAGQATDIIARVLADELGRSLGQTFIVENRPGAGGNIGANFAAKAAPDGYTLFMLSSAHAIAPSVYKDLPYDPVRDFAPISNLVLVIQTLVTSPTSGFGDTQAFVKAAKATSLNYGSPGNGTTSQLAMELFKTAVGLPLLVHVPFKGSPEAQTEVMAGRVQVMFDAMPGVLGNIQGGKLKALGVAYHERSPLLPNVPTMDEQGFKGFEAVGWVGLAAPAGTPAAILDQLNAEVRRILALPKTQEKLKQLAFTPAGGTREEFSQFIKSEVIKWAKAVQQSNTKIE
jgi:tripartite-type tricarboxylate transporter receptor subunit TctC